MTLKEKHGLKVKLGRCYSSDKRRVMEIAKREIDSMPTTEERPTGRWIVVDSYSAFGGDEVTWYVHGNPVAFCYCSNCKNQAYADEFGEDILSKFCPQCGALMLNADR